MPGAVDCRDRTGGHVAPSVTHWAQSLDAQSEPIADEFFTWGRFKFHLFRPSTSSLRSGRIDIETNPSITPYSSPRKQCVTIREHVLPV